MNDVASTNEAPIDLEIRVEFCHAALQHLARQHGIDLLHIKGMAFAPEWRSRGLGSDADVLVRPSQVARFIEAVEGSGWQRRSRFHTGSPFGHAQTYWHPYLGYADVHRFFPGLGPDEGTFDRIWAQRDVVDLAGVGCPVPERTTQALIMALNEARNNVGGGSTSRVQVLRDSELGAAVEALVPRLGAEVGWAAASGELDRVRDHRDHDLWRAVTQNTGRVDEWKARIKAAPSVRDKALLVLRAPLVNTEHLTNTRGHRPSAAEVTREFLRRAVLAARELIRSRHGGGQR